MDFLRKELKPKFIYLFGSCAKGEGREDSDIDLAIYTDEVISAYTLFVVANHLSFEVKRDVQIRDSSKQ
ncbi:nucleotidyltransferase domain-containing protein [Clostridiaceae bacterium 35-E11]